MGAAGKSIRDGGLTGGVIVLSTVALERAGLDAEAATAGGVFAGMVFARLYRAARNRFAWLREFDPAGGAQ